MSIVIIEYTMRRDQRLGNLMLLDFNCSNNKEKIGAWAVSWQRLGRVCAYKLGDA
jgi:hypothetical protein